MIALEPILGELERAGGRGNRMLRESGRYWMAVYGDPTGDGPWAWRLEGHHVSVRSTIVDRRVVSITPSFLGANPATVPSQNGANHIHSVWRDPANDWGEDVLAEHYREAHAR